MIGFVWECKVLFELVHQTQLGWVVLVRLRTEPRPSCRLRPAACKASGVSDCTSSAHNASSFSASSDRAESVFETLASRMSLSNPGVSAV